MSLPINDATLLLTNFDRPQNIVVIVNRFKNFLPIWIVNNNPEASIPNDYVNRVFNNDINKGSIDRWYKAIQCDTEYLIVLDDDVLPFKKTFMELSYRSKKSPYELLGISGRSGLATASKYEDLEKFWCCNAEVELITGSCLIIRTSIIRKIFNKYIQPIGKLYKEDNIILSLGLTLHTKMLHQTIRTEVELFPEYNTNKDYVKKWKLINEFKNRFN